jgi:hypothetical protein
LKANRSSSYSESGLFVVVTFRILQLYSSFCRLKAALTLSFYNTSRKPMNRLSNKTRWLSQQTSGENAAILLHKGCNLRHLVGSRRVLPGFCSSQFESKSCQFCSFFGCCYFMNLCEGRVLALFPAFSPYGQLLSWCYSFWSQMETSAQEINCSSSIFAFSSLSWYHILPQTPTQCEKKPPLPMPTIRTQSSSSFPYICSQS